MNTRTKNLNVILPYLSSTLAQPKAHCKIPWSILGYAQLVLTHNTSISATSKILRNVLPLTKTSTPVNLAHVILFYGTLPSAIWNHFMGFYLPLNLERTWGATKLYCSNNDRQTKIYHVSPVCKDLALLKLQDIYKLELAKFMYQLSFNKLPKIIESAFPKIENIHNHNIRHTYNTKFFLSRVSKNAARNQLSFKGIKLWQSIPDRIKTPIMVFV